MKVLIFGDIYGRIGRKAIEKNIVELKRKYLPDFVIANIENISSGRGPIVEHASFIHGLGVDLMTTGDHAFDNFQNIENYLNDMSSPIIRPYNFYDSSEYRLPGYGYKIFETKSGKLAVIQLLGESFMNHKVLNPYIKLEEFLGKKELSDCSAIILDFHRETTAELYGMAHIFDGRISCVYGTHTHVQTNDAQILEKGTSLISDVGMNGPSYSVIGADIGSVKKRFLTGVSRGKIEQSLRSEYVINAIILEIDMSTGNTKTIENISIRSKLI